MIAYVKGVVTHILQECVYVDVHDVGYRVYVPSSVRLSLVEGEETMLFTYTNVREDAMQLYGFSSMNEYDLFLMLISVSGIGPKVALNILSATTTEDFIFNVMSGDVKSLTILPGIGKKSAERLVLELKDKINSLGGDVKGKTPTTKKAQDLFEPVVGVKEEVLAGLMALGYGESEVVPVIDSIYDGTQEVSTLLRLVLAELGKAR